MGRRPQLRVKSVREPAADGDGERILVDRLWPRGVSRTGAHLDAWRRDLAPSDQLRRWFAHDPARWDEFRRRYRAELEANGRLGEVADIARRARDHPITLLFGARDREHNNAVALAEIGCSLAVPS